MSRRRRGLLAVVAVLAGAGWAPGAVVAQGVEVVLDLAYHPGPGADARHRLDLYLPVGRAVFPAVVFFHGGEWSGGDKDEGVLYGNVGQALASRGVAVALANYRLSDGSGSGVVHPAHVQDAARATSFVRAYLNARGVPPERLLVMGHDAGAHLAALLATNGRFLAAHGLSPADLAGVVGLSGVYRIEPQDGAYATVFGSDPLLRRDASPLDHVSGGSPPHLLLVAEDDLPGRAAQAGELARALVAAGVAAVAETVPGRDHMGIVAGIGQPSDAVTARVAYFAFGGSLATPTAPPTASPTGRATATPTPTPAAVAPPGPPADGPGGVQRPHAGVREGLGIEAGRVWWPIDPMPAEAPLVVLVPDAPGHGAESYRGWIEHVARGGVTVLVPRIEGEAGGWSASAASVLRQAVAWLGADGSPRPVPSGAVYVGEGAGGLVAATLASEWLSEGLPAPKAVLVASPRRQVGLVLGDLRRVPRDTLTLVLRGEEEAADEALDRALWAGLAEIPGAWRQFVLVRSDRHGTPGLVAGSGWARSDGEGAVTDALDWYGTWKWLDALASCAYWRRDCHYALGDTTTQRYMGHWADGIPVREPAIQRDLPASIVRVARFPLTLR